MTKTINVCLLGDIESNKSDLIRVFTNSLYDWYNEDTNEITKSYKYIYYKRPYNFILSDTDISNKYYLDSIKQCDAFILTFSLTTKKTGENLEYYYNLIQENKNKIVPIILVGISNEFGRFEFNIADIQKMKQKLGIPYTTTFQNDSNSIVSAFHLLIETIEEFENIELNKIKQLQNNNNNNNNNDYNNKNNYDCINNFNNNYNNNHYLHHRPSSLQLTSSSSINNNKNNHNTKTNNTTTTPTTKNDRHQKSKSLTLPSNFLKKLKTKLIK